MPFKDHKRIILRMKKMILQKNPKRYKLNEMLPRYLARLARLDPDKITKEEYDARLKDISCCANIVEVSAEDFRARNVLAQRILALMDTECFTPEHLTELNNYGLQIEITPSP